MRISPGTLALLTLGDAALVIGILGLAGVLHLGASAAAPLLILGVLCNALGIGRIVRAVRRGDDGTTS